MKLFLFAQCESNADIPGTDTACRRLISEGILTAYHALPYYGSARQVGWPETWSRALHQIRQMHADVILLHHFHGPIPDPAPFIRQVRELPWRPTLVVSSGDGFGQLTRRPPPCLRIAARHADLTFVTQVGGVGRGLVRGGARRVTLMPNGYCQARFDTDLDPAGYSPDFDVVMIGNKIRCLNPSHSMFYACLQRQRQVRALQKRYGRRFGLFGLGWDGWESAQGPIPYHRQVDICRRARVVVGAFPHSGLDYYTSDRDMIALRSGIPFVEYHIPRTDRLFVDGDTWHLFKTLPEMLQIIDRLLALDDGERLAMGTAAAAGMVARHSQYHRMRLMMEIIGQVRRADLEGRPAPLPCFDFFAPGVRLEGEWPYAALGWG